MIGGRYSLDREIGRGGMGAVYLGRDEVLRRPVALKRIGMAPGGSSPDLLRAEREARIAASLNHPHVIGVFDLVDDGEHQWLVMEYFAGTTLSDLVRRGGPLGVEAVTPIAVQVAEALAAAHEAGIVHRDVKPSNILVREDGQAKVSDFGIARAQADASLTQTGLVTGSPAYLAPEVAQGQVATPAADSWAFGATLFHALAGHPPYDVGDNVLGALYRIVNEPPPRLATAGALAPLLEATMTRDPDERWSMAQAGRFLQRLGGGPGRHAAPAPVTAGPAAPSGGDHPTQVLATPPEPVPATSPVAEATPAPTPAPPPPARPAAPTGGRAARRPFPVLPVVIGALAVALVVAVVLLITLDDPQRDPATGPGGATTSTDGGSQTPSPSTPTSSPPDPEAMAQFARDYVSTASSDPDAGFRQLTAAYQEASPDYAQFWGEVEDPEILRGPTADPDALTVTYTYRYRFQGGRRTEEVTLQLVRDGDSYLIAGAS